MVDFIHDILYMSKLGLKLRPALRRKYVSTLSIQQLCILACLGSLIHTCYSLAPRLLCSGIQTFLFSGE